MRRKITTTILAIFIAIIWVNLGYSISKTVESVKSETQTAAVNEVPIVEEIPAKETKIYFVGDIMLDRSVKTSVIKNFGSDYNQLFTNLDELKSADILFGNLEGPVSDTGNNVGSKYSFRMDPIVLEAIKNAGFDIVSFANNHVGDWNIGAFKDTLNRLDNVGILQTGAGMTKSEAEIPKIIEKNGVKFGFIGFSDVGPDWIKATDTSAGILLASDPRLGEIIKNAKQQVDVLIVSFHWGVEYEKIHNKKQEALAHTAIDNGADIVVGHHPHTMQDIEMYKEHPIVYSLGNFIFDQYFSKDTMQGMLFETTFLGKDLKETNKKLITLNKKYQPEGIFEFPEEKPVPNPCPVPDKKYPDYSYLDVGQDVAIPDEHYIPSDLKLLDKKITTIPVCIKEEAAEAITKMITKAKTEGVRIKVSSGFRDYATQKSILERNIAEGNKNATIAVAKPGHSEHQLGVAVDLTGSSIDNMSATTRFKGTVEDKWLRKNAYLYGFSESYPEDKEDITGYMYEAWHYRYVGIENAKAIKESGQTVNEYLKENKTTLNE